MQPCWIARPSQGGLFIFLALSADILCVAGGSPTLGHDLHIPLIHSGRITRLASCLLGLVFAVLQPLAAQAAAEDAVLAHFEAILAEQYVQADQYFSREFRAAFKGDVDRINAYYRTRAAQLARGYSISAISELDDGDRETMRVTVDFSDADPQDGVDITERFFYYLVRQNSTDRDAVDGKAWRIDIFDALRFDSLADARRRPYLYTGQEWDEFASSELIARQGLFRIQMALESFHMENSGYPFRLLGDDSRRDELISSNKLGATYPQCGFNDRPMRSVQFEEKSSGDFTYYSVDADSDGVNEGYWLILHGRDEGGFYFEGRDTIYILSDAVGLTQREQADGFSAFWQARTGTAPQLTDVTEFLLPEIRQGGPFTGTPATPSLDDLASEISRADPVSSIVDGASEMLQADQASDAALPEQAGTDNAFSGRGLAVARWISGSAMARIMQLLGPAPSPDPLAAIDVGEELTIHSFGSWD